MTKRERIAELEQELLRLRLAQPLTFDTLTICFSAHTVTLRGRVINVEADCLSIPLTNDKHLLVKDGWHTVTPEKA